MDSWNIFNVDSFPPDESIEYGSIGVKMKRH
jgi:hypothetical protein